MELRRAEPRDHGARRRADRRGVRASSSTAPRTATATSCATPPARDREAELWVAADDDGRLLGTRDLLPARLALARDRRAADEGEFRMLAVAPEARGRASAQALVALCVDRLREHGAARIVLSTLRR